MIGPYMHLPWNRKSADVDFGSEADNPIEDLQVAWFDHYLKGKDNGADKAPPVRVFVMGADRWRDADNWPIPGTQFTSYYLHSLGEANSSGGNGRMSTDKPAADEPPDRYVYDPANPVPSRGGHSCCTPDVAPVGPANQADIEGRGDVLVDSTPTLDHAVEVTGPVSLTLYAVLKRGGHRLDSEACRCFSGRPRDQSQQRHCARAVSRVARAADEHHARPGLQVRDQCLADEQRLLAGHQSRLEVSSSNFPHYDRNPNTGHPFGVDAAMWPAFQTIFHDAEHPSALTLPIMPEPMKPLAAN